MTEPSTRLYNADLAPTETRDWSGYSVFSLWMSVLHNVGAYTFAIGFFFLGLNAWQVLAAMLVANLLVYLLMNLSGRMGQRTGVPYPVVARASFGVFGANLPALVRGVLAVFWYGVQTYLGSVAVSALALRLLPELQSWTRPHLLGLSALGWCSFLLLWGIQLLVIRHGMDAIRRYQNYAGPAVYLVMFVLLIWVLAATGGNPGFDVTGPEQKHGAAAVLQFAAVVALIVSFFGTFLLNISDFTRSSPSLRSMRRANAWGLPVNFLVFALTVVVVTSGSVRLYGSPVTDPVALVQRMDNTPLLVFATVVFTVATIGVNVVANVVSPAFDFSNVAPKHITFTRGGYLAAVGSVLVCPWALYSNPVVVNYFIGGLGALLGPLFGVIIADYYLVRRGELDVPALYAEGGPYWYRNGVNRRAIIAAGVGAVPATAVALVPALVAAAPFSWVIGAALSTAAHRLLAGRAEVMAPDPADRADVTDPAEQVARANG